MANTRSRGRRKVKGSTKKKKKTGAKPDANDDEKIEEIGIDPLEFTDDEEGLDLGETSGANQGHQSHGANQGHLLRRSSLELIKKQESIEADFDSFLAANQVCSNSLSKRLQASPLVLRSSNVVRNLETSFDKSKKVDKVKITLEDIEEEISFWNSALVCYVLRANPPLNVLDGFVRRLWKEKIDKEDTSNVPIWIQLDDLQLKYWGKKSLFKIVGQLGVPIMVDDVTKERDKLSYPRVLIEVSIKQEFPNLIYFEDEFGSNVSVAITYEWKPTICSHCKGMGHSSGECRRKEGKQQEWVVKKDHRKIETNFKIEANGFQMVTNGWKVKSKEPGKNIEMSNSYQVLDELEIVTDSREEKEIEEEVGMILDSKGGGGVPPLSSG
uniref:DUF4283 domain-containing protein n=1 Tax=Cannabis sativa TaxID=3483 RepID=A0A803P4D5_CANSA